MSASSGPNRSIRPDGHRTSTESTRRASPSPKCRRRIRRRLVAPAAEPLGHPDPAAARDRDLGPHGVAVRLRPLELEDDEVPGALRLVVEVDQGLVLRDDDDVGPAIVVEVADGQAAAEVQRLERGCPRVFEASVSRPPGLPSRSCKGMVQGNRGRSSRTCPLAVIRSSQPSLLASKNAAPNPSSGTAGRRQADRGGVIGEEAAAEVAVERRRLAEVVRHGEVGAGRRRRGRRRRSPSRPGSSRPPRTRPRPPSPSPRTGNRPGCGKDSWPSCHWPRQRLTRPSPSRSAATTPSPRPFGSTMPACSVTSTNRPPSLRKT